MKLSKCAKRDRKINKRKYGMRKDGDSVKLIQKILEKRRTEILKRHQADSNLENYGNDT